MKSEFVVICIKTHRERLKNNRLYLNTGVYPLSEAVSAQVQGHSPQQQYLSSLEMLFFGGKNSVITLKNCIKKDLHQQRQRCRV